MKTLNYLTALRLFLKSLFATRNYAVVSILLLASSATKAGTGTTQNAQPVPANILFAQNKGQWPNVVTYRADVPGGTVFLEKNGFTYALVNQEDVSAIHPPKQGISVNGYLMRMHALKVQFLNGLNTTIPNGSNPDQGYSNYFIGKDPAKWASNVKSYKEISYNHLYDGVNMRVYSLYNSMKYDLIVAPHAVAGAIKIQYDGPDNMAIVNGDLKIGTTAGAVTEKKPYAYQIINGKSIYVPCNYSLASNIVSFVFPSGYNANYELVIDPNLIFSTLTGSTADNWGFTATYDAQGNFYTGGIAASAGYPITAGAYQAVFAGGGSGGNAYPFDVSISKYNPTGTARIFSTYIGGSDNENPTSMFVNASGELFVLGRTYSYDFPVTTGAYSTAIGGGADIFITHFNAGGTALIGSTFVGGSGDDGVNISADFYTMQSTKYDYGDDARSDMYVDAANNVYVADCSQSGDFPTVTPFKATLGGTQDGVVFKMNGALTTMQWSSYIGGSGDDGAFGITLDNSGNVLVTGGTTSSNFPVTAGAYHTTFGGTVDGFIAKIANNGSSIIKSTYVGTTAYDQSFLIQTDKNNNIYVAGQTQGAYPVSAGVYSNANSSQFIQKFDSTLTTSIFSTVIGSGTNTAANMSLTAFLVDVCGNLYLSGWGRRCLPLGIYPSGDVTGMPITANAYQKTTNGCNFYFIELSRDAISLLYGSYFGDAVNGEEHVDGGTSRFDKNGVVYQSVCAACRGFATGFPTTPGVVSTTNGSSNCNNGSIKMQFDNNFVIAGYSTPNGNKGCVPATVGFSNSSLLGSGYVWDFGDGFSSTAASPTHVFSTPGTYNVRLIANNATTCNLSDTTSGTVVVFPSPPVNAGPDVTICNGASTNLSATGGTNSAYIWTPVTGLSNPNIYNPVAKPTVTTTYIVNVTDTNGCKGSDSITVSVGSLIATASQNAAICMGASTQLSSSGGTIYTWNPANGLSNTTIFNPIASPSITTSYTVTVSNASGCSGTATVTVQVNPLPNVTFAPLANVCVNAAVFPLTGGSPGGGTYSGTGVAANSFSPSTAGVGTYTLTYNYTDPNGCSGSATSSITIDPAGNVTISSIPNMCVNASPVTLSGSPAGGTFSGTGVVSNTFNPAVAGAGTFTITYTYTASTCLNNTTASTTVTVLPRPSPVIVPSGPTGCASTYIGSVLLTANPSGLTTYQWYFNGVAISGATSSTYTATKSGWYNVIATLNGCASDSGNTGLSIVMFDVRCGHDTTKKVVICHVPDCRYDKQVTICIGEPAVPAHFKNHPCDCMGPCSTPHPNKRDADIDYSGIEFSVVPNPFSKEGVLEFFISDRAQTTLEIYNINGQYISKLFDQMAEGDVDYRVNVSGLAEGVYIAELHSGDFVSHVKMVVTK